MEAVILCRKIDDTLHSILRGVFKSYNNKIQRIKSINTITHEGTFTIIDQNKLFRLYGNYTHELLTYLLRYYLF